MKLTKALRDEIAGRLSHAYGRLALRLDGREVVFEVRLLGELKYCIVPFVDGKFKGGWLVRESEEFGSRLVQVTQRKAYSEKTIKAFRSIDRKKAEAMRKKTYETRRLFTSTRMFIAHLQREFETIELVE